MKPKVFILVIAFLSSFLVQYTLKNDILKESKDNEKVKKELLSERSIYEELTSDFLELQSTGRIKNIAEKELNMAYDETRIHLVTNTVVNNKRKFTMIDHIIPSAEALTTK